MIGLILGLIAAVALLALALSKPILFRLGVGYTKLRPKQTAFIVLGLMITTTIVAASGIMADSAANSFAREEASRFEHYDAYVFTWSFTDFNEEVNWDDLWNRPAVKDVVAYYEPFVETEVFLQDSSKIGDSIRLFLLPESVQDRVGFDIPERGLVVNEDYVKSAHAKVGDRLFLEGSLQESLYQDRQPFTGTMTAFFGPAGWVTPPTSNTTHLYDMTQQPLQLAVNSTLEEYTLVTTDPRGGSSTLALRGGEDRTLNTFADGEDYRGEWEFTLYAEEVAEPYVFEVIVDLTSQFTIGGWEGELAQAGTDVRLPNFYGGSYAFGNMEEFDVEDWQYQFYVKAKPGVSMAQLESVIDSELQTVGSGYIWTRSEDPDAEVALIRFAANMMFLSMGGLSIISGVILIVVLMGVLVEERKRTLGTMRALGATRGNITFMHVSEGAVYAGFAGLAGIFGGLLLAAALLGQLGEVEGDTITMSANPLTYISAGAGSALLILAVIAFSAHRVSRIDIATAIRGEEQDLRQGRERTKVWAIVWSSLAGLFLLLGLITGNATDGEEYRSQAPPGLTLGVSLASVFLTVGLAPLASKYVGRTVAMPIAAGALLLQCLLSFLYLDLNSEWDGFGLMVRAVVIPVCAAMLVAYSRALHEWVVKVATKFGGIAALWDSALSNIRAKPGRNTMTIAVLGSVLMAMTGMGAMFQTFSVESQGGMGGHDVLVHMREGDLDVAYDASGLDIDPYSVVDSAVLVPISGSGFIQGSNLFGPIWQIDTFIVGATPEFIDASQYKFANKQGDPWQQVLAGTGMVVGSRVTSWDGEQDRPVRLGQQIGGFEVVGILQGAGTITAFVGSDAIPEGEVAAFLKSDDPSYASRVWESAYRTLGAEAIQPALIVQEEERTSNLVLLFLTSFMGLGIVIGMVSLGLTTTRNVLTRRNEVGVLRAIGARTRDVVTIFAIETGYVTGVSILIGLVGGIGMAALFVNDINQGLSLELNWGLLALMYGVTLIAAACATAIPAYLASKIRPAEAVRYAE